METILGLLLVLLPLAFKLVEKKLRSSGRVETAEKVHEWAEMFGNDKDQDDDSDEEDDDESEDTLWDDSEDEDMDDVDSDNNDEDDELFKDDFALEDFQFAFDEDDEEETPSYEESDEFDELDLDSLDDIAGSDFAIPRSQYQVPVVFELTLEELMEMTDEY